MDHSSKLPELSLQQRLKLLKRYRLADQSHIFKYLFLVYYKQCLVLPAVVLGKPQKALKRTGFQFLGYVLA
ncbi:MAG: hypothetical protein Q7J38_17340, partial [Gallionella sp.]|nr:hypothetical protein [Gallionella sp.]